MAPPGTRSNQAAWQMQFARRAPTIARTYGLGRLSSAIGPGPCWSFRAAGMPIVWRGERRATSVSSDGLRRWLATRHRFVYLADQRLRVLTRRPDADLHHPRFRHVVPANPDRLNSRGGRHPGGIRRLRPTTWLKKSFEQPKSIEKRPAESLEFRRRRRASFWRLEPHPRSFRSMRAGS